jgi:CDP-diacylglycerol---serine O-phosphatidyltransferase
MNVPSEAISRTVRGRTSERWNRRSGSASAQVASRASSAIAYLRGSAARAASPAPDRTAVVIVSLTPGRELSLADAVTLANAVCGFAAVAIATRAWQSSSAGLSDHQVLAAAALIVAGGLLDSVDGAVARWRGGSALGEHLELMSDVVTFGLATSTLFAVDAASYGSPWSGLALVVACGYLLAVLLRLARYASAPERGLTGLPSPPSAMAAVSVIVLHPPPAVALGAFLTLIGLMLARFAFPRISVVTAPLMAGWWTLAALAAFGVLPAWTVAAFTLTAIAALLLSCLVPSRQRPRPDG